MNSKRILIVDDDTLVREVLVGWIQYMYPQYEVIEAADGFEALGQLNMQKSERPFDLILTDYQMPVMDGLDLARNIRQSWPNLRVVLMTGHLNLTQLHSEVCALKLDGLLEKPVDLAQLEDFLLRNNELN